MEVGSVDIQPGFCPYGGRSSSGTGMGTASNVGRGSYARSSSGCTGSAGVRLQSVQTTSCSPKRRVQCDEADREPLRSREYDPVRIHS